MWPIHVAVEGWCMDGVIATPVNRGEICVANFIHPVNSASLGSYFCVKFFFVHGKIVNLFFFYGIILWPLFISLHINMFYNENQHHYEYTFSSLHLSL